MIRDRLPKLKEVAGSLPASTESLVIIDRDEIDDFIDRAHSPALENLFKMYNKILPEFDLILINIESMKVMTQAKNSKKFDDKEFYKIRLCTLQIGNKLINKFQSIRKNLPQENDYSTLARMQRSMYYGFFENYVLVWSKTDQFFHEYEKNVKKKIQMQSKIYYDLTEEEIDTLIAHRVTTLYDANILETEQARKTLKALKERLCELQKLEKSIEEVHSLFIRLQILIADQGAIIQRIEKHFNDSCDFVEVAAHKLDQAEILKNKNRKNTIILICLGIFAVTTFLIPRKKKLKETCIDLITS